MGDLNLTKKEFEKIYNTCVKKVSSEFHISDKKCKKIIENSEFYKKKMAPKIKKAPKITRDLDDFSFVSYDEEGVIFRIKRKDTYYIENFSSPELSKHIFMFMQAMDPNIDEEDYFYAELCEKTTAKTGIVRDLRIWECEFNSDKGYDMKFKTEKIGEKYILSVTAHETGKLVASQRIDLYDHLERTEFFEDMESKIRKRRQLPLDPRFATLLDEYDKQFFVILHHEMYNSDYTMDSVFNVSFEYYDSLEEIEDY